MANMPTHKYTPGTKLLRRQYLYFCTSKASKLCTWLTDVGNETVRRESQAYIMETRSTEESSHPEVAEVS